MSAAPPPSLAGSFFHAVFLHLFCGLRPCSSGVLQALPGQRGAAWPCVLYRPPDSVRALPTGRCTSWCAPPPPWTGTIRAGAICNAIHYWALPMGFLAPLFLLFREQCWVVPGLSVTSDSESNPRMHLTLGIYEQGKMIWNSVTVSYQISKYLSRFCKSSYMGFIRNRHCIFQPRSSSKVAIFCPNVWWPCSTFKAHWLCIPSVE